MPLIRDGDRSTLTSSQKKFLAKLEAGAKFKDIFGMEEKEPHFFIRDRAVFISGEYGDNLIEYYGPKGYSEISPDIEKLATECGVFAEWENAACIAFWDI